MGRESCSHCSAAMWPSQGTPLDAELIESINPECDAKKVLREAKAMGLKPSSR